MDLQTALINTIIIILIITIVGYIIDCIKNILIKITYKIYGRKITMFLANKLTFIGTVHHELAHALFAVCTGAKVEKIELFKPQGDRLGMVMIQPRGNKIIQSIQLTMSAIAPVVLGVINIYLLTFKVLADCEEFWLFGLITYVIISILAHTTMSKQDIKNALKGLPVCSIIIFTVVCIFKINMLTLFI